jgi:hypothetical protein
MMNPRNVMNDNAAGKVVKVAQAVMTVVKKYFHFEPRNEQQRLVFTMTKILLLYPSSGLLKRLDAWIGYSIFMEAYAIVEAEAGLCCKQP